MTPRINFTPKKKRTTIRIRITIVTLSDDSGESGFNTTPEKSTDECFIYERVYQGVFQCSRFIRDNATTAEPLSVEIPAVLRYYSQR
ncbi:hypothetical protein AC249_AIPGENE24880 [Exaiptasia diaphana]|nr:hypothetical protein AC249_AIPGENE24880 [Exaiptasia diaphana]